MRIAITVLKTQIFPLSGGPGINYVTTTKDRVMYVHRPFEPSRYCVLATQRARVLLLLIFRTFTRPPPNIFLHLYCSLVRPHVAYAISNTCPRLKMAADYVESVQRVA